MKKPAEREQLKRKFRKATVILLVGAGLVGTAAPTHIIEWLLLGAILVVVGFSVIVVKLPQETKLKRF